MKTTPLSAFTDRFIHLTNATIPLIFLIVAWKKLLLSPSSVLLTPLLPSICGLQTTYAILSFPLGKKSTRKMKLKDSVSNKVMPLLVATFLTLAGSFVIQLTLILFGVPAFQMFPETTMLSLNIAFLAVFPLACIIQLDHGEWQKVYGLMYHGNPRVFIQSISVVVGAWLGAFPIPLDWNREWQKWPVTIITGAYIGYFLGGLIAWRFADFFEVKFRETDHQICGGKKLN